MVAFDVATGHKTPLACPVFPIWCLRYPKDVTGQDGVRDQGTKKIKVAWHFAISEWHWIVVLIPACAAFLDDPRLRKRQKNQVTFVCCK